MSRASMNGFWRDTVTLPHLFYGNLFLNITGDGGLQFNYTLKQVIFVVVVLDQLKYICELKGPSKQNCIVTTPAGG